MATLLLISDNINMIKKTKNKLIGAFPNNKYILLMNKLELSNDCTSYKLENMKMKNDIKNQESNHSLILTIEGEGGAAKEERKANEIMFLFNDTKTITNHYNDETMMLYHKISKHIACTIDTTNFYNIYDNQKMQINNDKIGFGSNLLTKILKDIPEINAFDDYTTNLVDNVINGNNIGGGGRDSEMDGEFLNLIENDNVNKFIILQHNTTDNRKNNNNLNDNNIIEEIQIDKKQILMAILNLEMFYAKDILTKNCIQFIIDLMMILCSNNNNINFEYCDVLMSNNFIKSNNYGVFKILRRNLTKNADVFIECKDNNFVVKTQKYIIALEMMKKQKMTAIKQKIFMYAKEKQGADEEENKDAKIQDAGDTEAEDGDRDAGKDNKPMLLSHLMKSFTVINGKLVETTIISTEYDNTTTFTTDTSQPNTNKSEYAFERTLKNNYKYNYINVVTSKLMDKDNYNYNKMMLIEDVDAKFANNFIQYILFKKYNINQCTYLTMINTYYIKNMESKKQNQKQQPEPEQSQTIAISEMKMQLIIKHLLQSFNESDQQSGIVSNNEKIKHNNIIMIKLNKNFTLLNQIKNINELQLILFSHIYNKIKNNTVNIICDFKYLNYKIIINNLNDKRKNYKIKNNNDYDQNYMSSVKKSIDKQKNILTTDPTTTTKPITNNDKIHEASSLNYKTTFNKNYNDSYYYKIDDLIKLQANEPKQMSRRTLRLCGGGEGSLSAGAGWGSPPSSNTNNPNAGVNQWGSANQSTPNQQWNAAQQQAAGGSGGNQAPGSSGNQAAGGSGATNQQANQQNSQNPQQQNPQNPGQKSQQPPGNPGGSWNNPPNQQNPNNSNQPPIPQQPQQAPPNNAQNNGNNAGIVGGGTSSVAAKNQLEQLTSMREALFSQDGWGCQNVNQETNWDIPGSPEPGPRNDPTGAGATQWKGNINNGTELWEQNLRNGGQPPPQPVQKAPWGTHTPLTNIGGTWGEDDEVPEQNVWTGTPNNPPGQNWNQQANANANNGMWPTNPNVAANVAKKENEWGGASGPAGGNWGDPRDMRSAGGPMDMRNIDPRDPRALTNVDMRPMDPREPIHGNMRGVTGRLQAPDMWPHPGIGVHGQMPINNKMGPGGAAANTPNNPQGWPAAQGPKELNMNKPSGWEEPSPPAARRSIPNYDDGTAFWGGGTGGGQQPPSRVPSGVEGNWNKVPDPMNRNMRNNPVAPGGPGAMPGGNRLPGAGGIKTETGGGGMWGHPGRNTWEDQHPANWDDLKGPGAIAGAGGLTPWTDSQSTWNKPNKPVWGDQGDIGGGDWSGPSNKLTTTSSEIIRSSKQFRILSEMTFKKDDIEMALRTTNMNMEEAIELLNQQQRNNPQNLDAWSRRPDEHSTAFDNNSFPNRNYPGPQPAMPFPPNQKLLTTGSGAGGTGGGNPNAMNAINNMPMQTIGKHPQNPSNAFNQQHTTPSQPTPGNAAGGQPSTQQLRMLVQQIQMAVHSGYLNQQILNQPLAPQTLVFLNQLLQLIKQMQMTQQSVQRNGNVNPVQLQMTINKQKQQIAQLQQQITQTQAIYIKSQAASNNSHIGGAAGGSGVNPALGMGVGNAGSQHDTINQLPNNFSELALNKDVSAPGYGNTSTSQQSRLNQWKLPSLEKNVGGGLNDSVDFSRAPGTTAKNSLPPTTPTTISGIGLNNDPGPWSAGSNVGDGWPNASSDADNKDWPNNQQSPVFTDLVPEFEPGKPWRGTQLKTIEDDPSITPGSVARNPLSISAAKEPDLFGSSSKTSPNEINITSSTWSFNPSTTQQNFTSTMPKLGSKTGSWSDSTSDLWAPPTIGKPTGPPPGLGVPKNGNNAGTATSEASDWNLGLSNWPPGGSASGAGSGGTGNSGSWFSTWLLLKNLTAQIDGSTLRTLCVQHGPLHNFHLYLNHGVALCKYNTREEAQRAQQALNDCVLGNTTICAESPSEGEVQNILAHLGVPSGSQSSTGNGNGNGAGGATTPSTWRPPSQQGPARTSGSDTWGDSNWPIVPPSNW